VFDGCRSYHQGHPSIEDALAFVLANGTIEVAG
jgi:hypothetical protein